MKKILRISLYVLGSLILLVALGTAGLLWNSHRKIHRTISVAVAPVPFSTDPAAAQRGEYLYKARGCAECHGLSGKGKTFINEPNGLFARGANLTLGAGSAVRQYTELDWARSIRHGIKPDGRPLFIMPSEDYARFSDKDVADIVAYIRSLPAQDAESGPLYRLPLIVKLVHGAGVMRDAAEKIDHSLAPEQLVPVAATAEYGQYLTRTCSGCHGLALKGGPIPGAPPDWPPAANLAAGTNGVMSQYQSLEQFKTMMHSGTRPGGTKVSTVMPFESFKHINDIDMEAMFVYLKSLKAEDGNVQP